jgi:UDP-N-acetyl-D-glucosamine dehydrogenase
MLRDAGAVVSFHDPFVQDFEDGGERFSSVPLKDEVLSTQDLIIITADHSDVDYGHIVEKSTAVFDTRNATRNVDSGRERIRLL